MIERALDLIAILFGIYVISTYKWQAKKYTEWQARNFKRKIAAWEIRIGRLLNIIVGATFIIVGILSLFGAIPVRQ